MNELLNALPSPEAVLNFLSAPATGEQLAVLFGATLLAWFLGSRLRRRLQPVIEPGVVAEGPRTAMRTGVLALIPLILWLLLLGAVAFLRGRGLPTDILRPAMLLVGALALIRMGVFVLRHSFSPGSRPLKAWEGVLTVTIWGLVALHILGWLPVIEQTLDEYALTFGEIRVSLYTVTSFVLLAALLLFVALWLAKTIQWRVMRSEVLDESLKIALSKLSKFVLVTLAVISAMLAAGIDLTALAVFGGALGVGLGLGLQRVVSNFVSGLILAFEGSIRPGDVISIGNTFGSVLALHARHIVVRTQDGFDILVPNETLLTSDITNWTYEDDRKVRLHLPLQISYQDDPDAVIARLVATARTHPRVLAEPAPDALLLGFGDSGMNLELRVWVDDPERGAANVRSELNLAMLRDLRTAGVTLPYPQREVRIHEAAPGTAPRPGPSPRGPAATSRSPGTTGSRAKSGRGRTRGSRATPPG